MSRSTPYTWSRVRGWAGREVGLLAALFVAAAGLAGFAALVDEVGEGDTRVFDQTILLSLRNPADPADPIGPWWVEHTVQDITTLGGTTVLTLICLVAIGYLLIEKRRRDALIVLVSAGGGLALNSSLKYVVARPRPELVAHLVDVRTLSFPSGHAMLSTIVYLTLGVLLARERDDLRVRLYIMAVAILLTLMIGTSRVYLGVHWPTDVLAGWAVGAAWAMLVSIVAPRLGPAVRRSPPR